jgi:glycosyltransferase involved in cell wall biosynthesis
MKSYIENGKNFFDTVVTGSTWCEAILKNYGLVNVRTIIQGIDPTIFNPSFSEKEYFQENFIIFSGGKFEFRKGQDIVIKSFKILHDKYDDIMLINCWHNQWPSSMNTMSASKYIYFSSSSSDYITTMNKIFVDNGVDLKKVMIMPIYPNIMLPRVYKNTDVGLFPNRCEGGTNLVLMEYMACGKPAIAAYNSGHKDILTDSNSILLTQMRPVTLSNNNVPLAVWDEPSLDETVAKLEWAYNNRDSLKKIGLQAGNDLCKMTWQETARNFYDILR